MAVAVQSRAYRAVAQAFICVSLLAAVDAFVSLSGSIRRANMCNSGKTCTLSGTMRRSPIQVSSARVGVPETRGVEGVQWRKVGEVDVVFPAISQPKGVIHFCGGAIVGAYPKFAYGPLLEALAAGGYAIIGTPLPVSPFDHDLAAAECAGLYRGAELALAQKYGSRFLETVPVFGVGHSLGAKVHVLLAARDLVPRRRGNVLLAFNNFAADDSVPLLNELRQLGEGIGLVRGIDVTQRLGEVYGFLRAMDWDSLGLKDVASRTMRGMDVAGRGLNMAFNMLSNAVSAIPREFSPDPATTWSIVENDYRVPRNLIIQFEQDGIDMSPRLSSILTRRFIGRDQVRYTTLPGTHITPNTPYSVIDLAVQTGGARPISSASTNGGSTNAATAPMSTSLAVAAWAEAPSSEVGRRWFDERGFEEISRVAAEKARRELEGLAATILSYLDGSSLWGPDAAAELPR